MAESAPGSSLYAESEPVFDVVCHPCRNAGKNVEAEGYCVDCDQHLCKNCCACHKILDVLKHHKVVGKDAIPKKQVASQDMDICTERCGIHKQEIIKYHCPTHNVLGCSACVMLKHKLCEDVAYIPEVVSGLKERKDYKEFKAKLDDLIQTSEETISFAEENKKRSSDCQTRVLQEIDAYRQEIIDSVDKEIKELKDHARLITAQDLERMDKSADEINRVLEELKSISSNLNDFLRQKLFCKLFIKMETQDQSLTKLQGKLEDVGGTEVSEYLFQPNEGLRTALRGKCGFGPLRDMMKMNATHAADIDPDPVDNRWCKISGLTLLSTDKLVAADHAKDMVRSSILPTTRLYRNSRQRVLPGTSP